MDDATYWLKRRVEKLETRLEKFESIQAILKAHNMHETTCRTVDPSPVQKLYPKPCDCWLSEQEED